MTTFLKRDERIDFFVLFISGAYDFRTKVHSQWGFLANKKRIVLVFIEKEYMKLNAKAINCSNCSIFDLWSLSCFPLTVYLPKKLSLDRNIWKKHEKRETWYFICVAFQIDCIHLASTKEEMSFLLLFSMQAICL